MLIPPAWLLVLCVALGPLAMTVAVPANTVIMREFNADYGAAQSVLTVFLLALGASQLFLGWLSDRFGRRPVMMAGLAVFALGCFLSALAPSLDLLLASRIVQGIGASAGMSLSRAIVRDVYSREKSASVIGYMGMAMIVAPMIGPGLGGLITEHYDWRLIFVVMAVLAVGVFSLVVVKLPETGGKSKSLSPRFIPSAARLLAQPSYLGYAMSMTFASGMFFSFQSGAPFLILESMQRSPTEYGAYFAMTAFGYFLGNLLSGRYSERVGPDRMIQYGQIPLAIGLVLYWALSPWQHPLGLFLPMTLLTMCNGLTIPNAMAGALSVKPELAGTSAGLSGFLQIGTGSLLTFIVGYAQDGSVWPLLIAITFCAAMTAVGAGVGRRAGPGAST
ncbi:MAG: multidrug effflux MFS transporter [Burkholderiaceae bacterium]